MNRHKKSSRIGSLVGVRDAELAKAINEIVERSHGRVTKSAILRTAAWEKVNEINRSGKLEQAIPPA